MLNQNIWMGLDVETENTVFLMIFLSPKTFLSSWFDKYNLKYSSSIR